MDNPLPNYVEAIAQSLDTPMWWNQQNLLGATINLRTRGWDRNSAPFDGYRLGKNRSGSEMDIIGELLQPKTIDGQPYDALVLTERHDIVSTLMWEDTVRYARHFHDRFIDGNPQGTTYFYHSWLGVPDKSDPRDWIAFERAVAPAWQCVATRINQSLQSEGRSDRMVYLPAGLALASLVENATQGAGVAGVTGSSVRETLDRIFDDDVHLKPLGIYYMALVNYASVYRRSPVGAWAPTNVSPAQAQSLQAAAWQVVSNHINSFTLPDLTQCRSDMHDSVCTAFFNFTKRPDQIQITKCQAFFTADDQNNPFHFDASTDASYWFPDP
jgi:hypothetical protein